MKKKLSTLLLVICLVLSLAQTAFAATPEDGVLDTEEELVAAFAAGGDIVLGGDITTTASLSVPANATVTLDLAGYTISGTDNSNANYALININPGADLTVKDSSVGKTGKITLTATNNRGWNSYSSVITNQRGKLTVDGGTIEHLGGTDMAYGIDNLTNGKGTYAETVINDGTVKSTYRAIRQFLNGTEAQNILTVNGGTIEGTNKSVWMQDPNKNANSGTLTVSSDATLNGDVYLFVTAGSTEWPVTVSIAADALNGESAVKTGNIPDGCFLLSYTDDNGNTVYGKAVEDEVATVTLLADGTVVDTITVKLGNDVVLPEVPVKEGHTGAWDNDGKNITADIEINAVYTLNEYTITFMCENGFYKILTVKHGEAFEMPAVPEKEGYTVTWDKVVTAATGDMTINAVYTKISAAAPDNSNTSSPEPDDSKENKNPNTGDDSVLGFVTVIAVICVALVLTTYSLKRKLSSGRYMR